MEIVGKFGFCVGICDKYRSRIDGSLHRLDGYEVLNRTSEVTYKICKRGWPERWTKVHFNRLKPFIGENEVRRSKRNAARPMPLYEEIPSVSDESDKEKEDRTFHLFSGTSAETRANCNRPRVTFEKLPVVIEESQTEDNDREVSHPYEETPPSLPSPPIATYEPIDENDSDNKIPDDNRPRVPFSSSRNTVPSPILPFSHTCLWIIVSTL